LRAVFRADLVLIVDDFCRGLGDRKKYDELRVKSDAKIQAKNVEVDRRKRDVATTANAIRCMNVGKSHQNILAPCKKI
jgi:hypothetical protein